MKTRTFKNFLKFTIRDDDLRHVYIEFNAKAANNFEINTCDAADEVLCELYGILDPLIELCNIEKRSFIINIDMDGANLLLYKANILIHMVMRLHDHIQTERHDLTEKCRIENPPFFVKPIYTLLRPFIRETFVNKIEID
jgi:CRAL/TRIO domain